MPMFERTDVPWVNALNSDEMPCVPHVRSVAVHDAVLSSRSDGLKRRNRNRLIDSRIRCRHSRTNLPGARRREMLAQPITTTRGLKMLVKPKRARSVATFALLATFGVLATHQTFAADSPAMTQPTSKLTYVRLYTTPDGVSHFADDAIGLAPRGVGTGPEATMPMSRLGDVKGATFALLAAGATEDWHTAPRRQFMICLRGLVEVTASDGETRRISPGQMVLVEDLTGKGHITHAAGSEDHVALAVPVPDGVPVSTRKTK